MSTTSSITNSVLNQIAWIFLGGVTIIYLIILWLIYGILKITKVIQTDWKMAFLIITLIVIITYLIIFANSIYKYLMSTDDNIIFISSDYE